jgi:protocatechuate 3,4-dioxygenase, alpha subunit
MSDNALPDTTPSQTVGPFLHLGLDWPDGRYVVPEGTAGAIWIRGNVVDGQGEPVPDALIETWQADPEGRYDQCDEGERFRGFGRCPTDADGAYAIQTLKPGLVPYLRTGRKQAPHIDVSLLARGLLQRLVTRVYFADEPDANAADPVLASLPEAARATLLATPTGGGYRFDVHLQGDHETAFFDV